MPSADGPIFCRKELGEKVGVKVRFFLGLSQRTQPIFLSQASPRKNRTDFFIGPKVSAARGLIFYRGYCV